MTVKEFLLIQLGSEINLHKKKIRENKKIIKVIESMQSEVRNKTEGELLKHLGDDPELLAEYEKLQGMYKEVEEAQLKEASKNMKVTNYDKEGRELDESGNIKEGGRKVDPRLAKDA